MSERYLGGIITATYNPLLIPNPPTIGTATAGDASASVTFTAPTNVGGGAITSYVAVSSPGGFTGSAASSPVTVSGLTNGTAYTFQVYAVNAYGPSEYSAASNSVTPVAPVYIEDVFNTYLYTGTGSAQTITNSLNLSTDGGLVWIKARSIANAHSLFDTARGATKRLSTSSAGGSAAETTDATSLTAFNNNGFSIGADNGVNENTYTFTAWTFIEKPKFFDIVTYSGDSVDNRQISHNLGSTPGCVIVRRLSGDDWFVYHRSLAANYGLRLNKIDSESSNTSTVKSVSSTTFTVGTDGMVNVSGSNYVAYLFAHDAGGFGNTGSDNVITCGSYTGNGSTSGPTVTLGYEPQWLMVKTSTTTGSWQMIDNMRGMVVSGNDQRLIANSSSAELTNNYLSPTATGFQLVSDSSEVNGNGQTYIYIAIRRGPMKTPTSGTSVFSPVLTATASETVNTVNFTPDMQLIKQTGNAVGTNAVDRLRGVSTRYQFNAGQFLLTNSTNAESSNFSTQYWNNTGFSTPFDTSGISTIYWTFRRAPGFFDVVCYTGNGTSNRAITHNLGVTPELIIVKDRTSANLGMVYNASGGAGKFLRLFDGGTGDYPFVTNSSPWNDTAPTSTQFTVDGSGGYIYVNASNDNYVAYLFASVSGVSKVGSYTGTGALQTVNCGFTGGARFVLIKRTDSTGDWWVYDSARGISSGNDPYLFLNSSAAEVTGTNYVDTTSVGFQVTAAAPAGLNASGGTYIFLAIA